MKDVERIVVERIVEEAINAALLIHDSPQGIGDPEIFGLADDAAKRICGDAGGPE